MPTDPEPLTIPVSKIKVLLIFAGSVGFIVLGTWLWTIAENEDRHNPYYIKAVGVISILFFGLCGVYAFVKLLDTKPGLIIDAEGIVDNSSAFAVGRIPWGDITEIRVVPAIKGQWLIGIAVGDPKKYIERGNKLSRLLLAANANTFGTPVLIASSGLKIGLDDLARVLTEAFERHGGNHV